jgi:protein-tyrosine phosphatase
MAQTLPPFNDADQIIPNVWLGNARAAKDETFLKNAGIKTVFNCTKDLPFHSSIKRRYRIPVDDNLQPEEIRNMELWSLEIVIKMINEYKEGNPIFVHCHAGMQRSPAAVAMFLMALKGMTLEQAKGFIKERRPIVFQPSANFQRSMEGFQQYLQEQEKKSMNY